MSKQNITMQSKIRELTAEHIYSANGQERGHYLKWNAVDERTKERFRFHADRLLKAQASQGAVIKIDKDLPEKSFNDKDVREYVMKLYDYYKLAPTLREDIYSEILKVSGIVRIDIDRVIYQAAQREMLQAGYEVVEPLIEVK